MFNGQLSTGAIAAIYRGEPCHAPLLQVLDVKKIQAQAQPGTADRYRLILSDGVHYQQAMLASQLNGLVKDEIIANKCVVRLNEFICNTVHSRRIVIVLQIEMVNGSLPQNVGNPTNVETAIGGAPTAQAAQPPAQPPSAAAAGYQQAASHSPVLPPAPSSGFQAPRQQQQPPFGQPQARTSTNPTYQPRPQQQMQQQQPAPSIGEMASSVFPIKSLNPYQNRWTIKARVTSKSDIKTWTNAKGDGRLFSVDLLDAQGGEIRATGFNDAVDKFYQLLEVNRVYYISGGAIKGANKKFSSIKNDYELTFEARTQIQLAPDSATNADIPTMQFSFSAIDAIAGQHQKDDLVDVIGIVIETGSVQNIQSRAGKDLVKRSVQLVDMSARSVEVTLWGQQAEQLPWSEADKPVVAFKGAKVSEFKGRGLTTVSSTHIAVNPDLREAHALRGWFDSQGGHVSAQPLSSMAQGGIDGEGGGFISSIQERKTFSQIKDENLGRDKQDNFVLRGLITQIRHEGTMWYTACPTKGCNKKVTQEATGWHCVKCNKTYPQCEERYVLSLAAADHTGSSWLSAFNDQGIVLLGKTASELARLKESQPGEFDASVQRATFRQYKFKVKARTETWQDEARVKCSILAAEPLDFVEESKYLLNQIRQY
eukprot:TRINITY_DN4229_c0_g2_i1.p1 TRINITY_DN4229_c0_g2~~TRINITY_DN4229_c0_g2_i1.p1  ORF type:complete len:652 (-),score=238.32 TRINITY_DN4229_c0_g2_i1:174-2129(-)